MSDNMSVSEQWRAAERAVRRCGSAAHLVTDFLFRLDAVRGLWEEPLLTAAGPISRP